MSKARINLKRGGREANLSEREHSEVHPCVLALLRGLDALIERAAA
jgi:hypothetical protein